jgi:hypothetical protein
MQQPAMPQMRGGLPGMPAANPAMPPAAIPVAAPFPVAAQAARGNGHGAAAGTMAPPVAPPSAPRRPMDEIESLASQPTTRRRLGKKRQKTDYSKEIMIGGIVAAFAGFLIIVFLAVRNQDPTPSGFNGIGADGDSNASKAFSSAKASADKIAADKLAADKAAKAKQAEKDKKKLAEAAAHEAKPAPMRRTDPVKSDVAKSATAKPDIAKQPKTQPAQPSGDGDIIYPPNKPDTDTKPAETHEAVAAQPTPPPQNRDAQNHDTPQDLGTDNDPVFDQMPSGK